MGGDDSVSFPLSSEFWEPDGPWFEAPACAASGTVDEEEAVGG